MEWPRETRPAVEQLEQNTLVRRPFNAPLACQAMNKTAFITCLLLNAIVHNTLRNCLSRQHYCLVKGI